SSRVGVRPLRQRRLAPASPARSSSSPQRCAVAGAVYRSRDARLTATLAQECTCPSALHADTSTVPASRRAAKLKRRTTGRRPSPDAYGGPLRPERPQGGRRSRRRTGAAPRAAPLDTASPRLGYRKLVGRAGR